MRNAFRRLVSSALAQRVIESPETAVRLAIQVVVNSLAERRAERAFTGERESQIFALTLVAEFAGLEAAQEVKLSLKYAPSPLFVAGSPEIARPTLWAPLARSSESAAERLKRVKALAGTFAGGKLRFQSIDRVSFTLIY